MDRTNFWVVIKQTIFENGVVDFPFVEQIICHENDYDYGQEYVDTILDSLKADGWRRSREYYAGGYIFEKPGVKMYITVTTPLSVVNM